MDANSYIYLTFLAVLWCVVHSLLIAVPVTGYFRRKLGSRYRYYRISYNIFSLITVLPLMYYERSLRGEVFFDWPGYLQLVQIFLYILVIFLVYEGARQFSGSEFLGLRQLRNRMTSQALTSTGELNTRGILGVIRHPWYTAALIVIWIRPLSTAVLCVNTVFTLYLVFGAWLEEQKLIGAYGNEYREYRRRVSMFIPLKWLRSVLKK